MCNNYKIWLEGGMGDSLKVLSFLYPMQYLHDTEGTITYITYGKKYNDCNHEVLFKILTIRNNALKWINPEDFDNLKCEELTWRKECKTNFPNIISPLKIKLAKLEQEKINKPQNYIVIQLSSNDGVKCWGRNNYVSLCEKILQKTNYEIVVFDWEHTLKFELKHKRIHDFIGNNLFFNLNVIKNAKLLIAPDSWSKYVARWYNVPQILMCCELSYMQPKEMFESCFGEIYLQQNVKILGIESGHLKDLNNIKLRKDIKEIKVDEVFENIRRL